ncbi:MAG TPA: hypothetical protein VFH78_05655 [Candidatus Thermoplasmatota archaeon]|nr:hypothetical protein [Candidatus Thermoplasmatota archaeon]
MRLPLVIAVVLLTPIALHASAAPPGQNDAGTGADAGNTFADATPLPTRSAVGTLAPQAGDPHDWYKLHLDAGEAAYFFAYYLCGIAVPAPAPVALVAPDGTVLQATPAPCFSTSASATSRPNLILPAAPVAGEYRIHFSGDAGVGGDYTVCRTPCAWPDALDRIDLMPPYPSATFRTLVIPPAHGDLGNPEGPTADDYVRTTLDALAEWDRVLDEYAARHPQHAYLAALRIEAEVYNGTQTLDGRSWDVEVHFLETHYGARGAAGCGRALGLAPVLPQLRHVTIAPLANCSIFITLVNSASSAGELIPDFVTLAALRNSVLHEFGHIFGLVHTWTYVDGRPDLMVSPAPFYWGDGSIVGDGGAMAPRLCVSSLDLEAIAYLYRWIPTGVVQPPAKGSHEAELPYELYC